MKKRVSFLASLLLASAAQAGPLEEWGRQTSEAYNSCAFLMSSAIMFGDDPHYAGTRACVDREMGKAKADFSTVLSTTPPSAAPLMKDYFSAWIAAMQSLSSLQYGSKINADRSYSDSKRRLAEMWSRLAIEIGI